MAWTLRDIISEATTYAGMKPDDIHPSRVSFYVNQAQRDVANRVQQLEFERLATSSTSSGDDKMFLPTDCERVLALSFDTGTGNRVIRQGNIQDVDNKSWGTGTGMPQLYLSYASWVQFYPSPNSSYSLVMRYIARLSDITNLTSIPSVDTRYHQAVLFKTVEYLSNRQGDLTKAAAMVTLFEREINEQPSVTAQRQLDRTGMSAGVQLTGSPSARFDFDTRNGA
jgi:hypothetical protein